jgi:hypothetical protein
MLFKITMPKDPDMLPMYVRLQGPYDQSAKRRAAQALQKVERVTGPLRGANVAEIADKDLPEGESVF